jgi:hypothetical protein
MLEKYSLPTSWRVESGIRHSGQVSAEKIDHLPGIRHSHYSLSKKVWSRFFGVDLFGYIYYQGLCWKLSLKN